MRGRKPLRAMPADVVKAEVAELMADLKASTDIDDRKRLRRSLRRRGHTGGLGIASRRK